MIDARDKLTAHIRRAIEDEARLELVTSPGKPTPRGGYDTTRMFAQNGTATSLTIEAAWYSASASFTLAGPAVEQADEAFWAARGLRRGRQHINHGPLQCRLLVPYADGGQIDLLLAVLPALLVPNHAEATATYERAARERAQENPAESLPEGASPGRPAAAVKAQAAPGGPERDEPAAPGLTDGQAFTGPAGAPVPGSRGQRPAGAAPSPGRQTRPGRRQ